MSDQQNLAERRKSPRVGCAGDAEIVVPGRGLRYPGRVVDLSTGGCFIEAQCRLERGTMVEIWMNPEGQPLRLAANLLVRRPTGVGCGFVGVTERKLQQIRQLIAELEAEARNAAGEEEAQPAPKEQLLEPPVATAGLPAVRSRPLLRRLLTGLFRRRRVQEIRSEIRARICSASGSKVL